ncbi:MAG: hypothetical protein RBU37_13035 [Myxococcota bacterium]|nr:hypothetical protein [Myxococcota bacterium]
MGEPGQVPNRQELGGTGQAPDRQDNQSATLCLREECRVHAPS